MTRKPALTAWEERLKELNRLPVQGPNGPTDAPGIWVDPFTETREEFLARCARAYDIAKRGEK